MTRSILLHRFCEDVCVHFSQAHNLGVALPGRRELHVLPAGNPLAYPPQLHTS